MPLEIMGQFKVNYQFTYAYTMHACCMSKDSVGEPIIVLYLDIKNKIINNYFWAEPRTTQLSYQNANYESRRVPHTVHLHRE